MKWTIKINDWLYVGALPACGKLQADICVHVWRDDFPEVCAFCGYKENIKIEYKDGEELSAAIKELMQNLAVRLKVSRETVLIHCHAGQTRSPSLAAYLLALVEDRDVFDSIAIVGRCLWLQRGLPINIGHKFLRSVAPTQI